MTKSRSDLAQRKEFKFAIPGSDVVQLRRLLEVNARPILHNQRVSKVRSIYFDDEQMSACFANLNGLGRRAKFRIRWYDSLIPACHFFVEIKWRHNRITGKHRLEVHGTQPLAELTYKEMLRELIGQLPDELKLIAWRYNQPTLLVEYSREHFQAAGGEVRLTIDYDIAFYDQFGRRSINTRFRQPFREFVVIEGKTTPGRERELRRLLFPLSTRVTRCSKYVYGCQALGLASSRL